MGKLLYEGYSWIIHSSSMFTIFIICILLCVVMIFWSFCQHNNSQTQPTDNCPHGPKHEAKTKQNQYKQIVQTGCICELLCWWKDQNIITVHRFEEHDKVRSSVPCERKLAIKKNEQYRKWRCVQSSSRGFAWKDQQPYWLMNKLSRQMPVVSRHTKIKKIRHYAERLNHVKAREDIKKKTPWFESVSELYQLSDCRLSAKLVPTFVYTGSLSAPISLLTHLKLLPSSPCQNQLLTNSDTLPLSMPLHP
jgi:hypothetical protein